jgi:hypothetical protein
VNAGFLKYYFRAHVPRIIPDLLRPPPQAQKTHAQADSTTDRPQLLSSGATRQHRYSMTSRHEHSWPHATPCKMTSSLPAIMNASVRYPDIFDNLMQKRQRPDARKSTAQNRARDVLKTECVRLTTTSTKQKRNEVFVNALHIIAHHVSQLPACPSNNDYHTSSYRTNTAATTTTATTTIATATTTATATHRNCYNTATATDTAVTPTLLLLLLQPTTGTPPPLTLLPRQQSPKKQRTSCKQN